jgi:MFS family permease
VTRSVPADQRARGLGIQIGVTYVGLTIGPSLGGAIAGAFGWNAIFVVTAIVGAAGGLASLIVLDADEARDEKQSLSSFDFSGAGFLAFALGTLITSMRGSDAERPFALLAALFGMSLVSFYVFWRHEAAHPAPLLPPSLMKTRPFALGIVGGIVLYTVTFVLSFLLPFHLQHVFDYTPRQAGIVMTAQPATMAVVAPLAGIFADRFGPRVPATLGMIAIGAGLFLVSSAPSSMLSLAVVGFGAGLYTTPNNAMIMGAAPKERQATAGAFAATARNVGMTFGVALAAVLERSFGFAPSLRIAAGLAAVGAVLALFR